MADTAAVAEVRDITTAPRNVHHHAVPMALDDYALAVALGLDLTARCGTTTAARPDATALPCCPDCATRLAYPCQGAPS